MYVVPGGQLSVGRSSKRLDFTTSDSPSYDHCETNFFLAVSVLSGGFGIADVDSESFFFLPSFFHNFPSSDGRCWEVLHKDAAELYTDRLVTKGQFCLC